MKELPSQEALAWASKAWHQEETRHISLDPALHMAFARILDYWIRREKTEASRANYHRDDKSRIPDGQVNETEEKVQVFLSILMEEAKRYSLMGLLRGYGFSEQDYGQVEAWFKERGFKL